MLMNGNKEWGRGIRSGKSHIVCVAVDEHFKGGKWREL